MIPDPMKIFTAGSLTEGLLSFTGCFAKPIPSLELLNEESLFLSGELMEECSSSSIQSFQSV